MMKLSRLLAVVCFFLPIAFIATDARAAFLGFREEGERSATSL